MSTLDEVVTGDINTTRTVQLGGVQNLDNVATIEAHVWFTGNDDAVTLTASVTDSANRYVAVDFGNASGWLATLTALAPGRQRKYTLEIEATFNDSSVVTWPTVILPVRGGA